MCYDDNDNDSSTLYLLFVLLFCIVVLDALVVVTGVQSSLLSRCIVVFFSSSCCSSCSCCLLLLSVVGGVQSSWSSSASSLSSLSVVRRLGNVDCLGWIQTMIMTTTKKDLLRNPPPLPPLTPSTGSVHNWLRHTIERVGCVWFPEGVCVCVYKCVWGDIEYIGVEIINCVIALVVLGSLFCCCCC